MHKNYLVYNLFKRSFDIAIGIIGLVFVVPLYVVIRFAYFFTGDFHRIIYAQTRIGLHGNPFKIYKFRTMIPKADGEPLKELLSIPKYRKEWDEFHKIENDPRITKIGHFLRKSSIDEFPQFVNILIGNLSLVGPRPTVPGELKEHHGNEKLYHSVKPGLTGYWAVNGRSSENYTSRLKLEYYYINHRSLALDCQIIFKTFSAVLQKSGAK